MLLQFLPQLPLVAKERSKGIGRTCTPTSIVKSFLSKLCPRASTCLTARNRISSQCCCPTAARYWNIINRSTIPSYFLLDATDSFFIQKFNAFTLYSLTTPLRAYKLFLYIAVHPEAPARVTAPCRSGATGSTKSCSGRVDQNILLVHAKMLLVCIK